ncbi:MAG: 30S ribosomal protein S17 [Candidatus Methanogranum gryphiswaldense]|jgi:small subunit ribosomal protein S17|nr:MAG: 30S ribosomal protein S17 [Candidatus Methanogranum sp. U3.2.1]
MTAKTRNIGIDVVPPTSECNDPNCPFHGSLPVRGQVIEGVVATVKMSKTVIVERNYLRFEKKYERYEKRSARYACHASPCLGLKVGDRVRIMECRPISKTVSFVVVEKKE